MATIFFRDERTPQHVGEGLKIEFDGPWIHVSKFYPEMFPLMDEPFRGGWQRCNSYPTDTIGEIEWEKWVD